nr:putative reverse transcriptase domain-containing protein [Tanacetum cinerariifolium]
MEKRDVVGYNFLDRIWILMVGDVRTLIMEDAHTTKYSVCPGAEIGESKMIRLEMEQETTKVAMIKEKFKEAKDPQEIVKLIWEIKLLKFSVDDIAIVVRYESEKIAWPIVVRHESEKTTWPIVVRHAYVKMA